MKTLMIAPLNDRVAVRTETNVLDTLLAQKCDVSMACGGQGICSTCHVFIREGHSSLTPMTDREKRTLSLISGGNKDSRLACQCKVIGEGVVIEVPEGMYVSAASDLTTLIGRRTEVPILHPRDSRVLIAKGCIITKSRIQELEAEDLDAVSLRSNTAQA